MLASCGLLQHRTRRPTAEGQHCQRQDLPPRPSGFEKTQPQAAGDSSDSHHAAGARRRQGSWPTTQHDGVCAARTCKSHRLHGLSTLTGIAAESKLPNGAKHQYNGYNECTIWKGMRCSSTSPKVLVHVTIKCVRYSVLHMSFSSKRVLQNGAAGSAHVVQTRLHRNNYSNTYFQGSLNEFCSGYGLKGHLLVKTVQTTSKHLPTPEGSR